MVSYLAYMSDDSQNRENDGKRSERRTSSRFRLAQPPEVEILSAESDTPVKARLGDLSRGGCYIETECVLPLETEVTITLKKSGDQIRAQARIVRAFPNKGLGLAFTSMEGDGFRILDSWLSAFVATTWVAANRRRTQRAVIQIGVRVSGYNAEGVRFTEDTRTSEISALGCAVVIQTQVRRGQRLVLTNLQTKVTAEFLVVYHDAKGTAWEVGLAFTVPNRRFWPIAFPPANWTSRDPNAK
jgi:c-di-GMP-binding flagellar brake protein YcgR